jgi:phospholipid/cholesterol/gamma-HCH transport system permease protein
MIALLKTLFERIGETVLLVTRSLKHLPTLPRQWKRCLDHAWFMGYATAPLVALLSLSIGAVLALQIGDAMRAIQIMEYIGSIVGVAMVRELGPVMTAIMVAGRVVSATTAELASMRVYQEVDALRTMRIPPERILVLPRLAAMTLVMPFLVMLSIVTGWIGGQIVVMTVPWIDLTTEGYYTALKQYVDADAVIDGLIKGEVFGIVILSVACSIGLETKGGPREIGQAVTKAVVASITLILAVDYFITNVLIAT